MKKFSYICRFEDEDDFKKFLRAVLGEKPDWYLRTEVIPAFFGKDNYDEEQNTWTTSFENYSLDVLVPFDAKKDEVNHFIGTQSDLSQCALLIYI